MNRHSPLPVASRRPGITLLEVLVACGILVIGLASLASVLPAAGSRLAQASVEDRAGIAAANAYAECIARGLITSDIFVSATRACGFGRGFEKIVDQIDPTSRRPRNPTLIASTTAAILQPKPLPFLTRIDEVRGFTLEDDLLFPASAADTPLNGFVMSGAQVAGHRLSRPGVCWGAMLAPVSGTAVAGAEATLSIAVFRKECEETASLLLTQQSGALYRVISGTTVSESGQTAYLPGPMGTNSPLPNADIAALRKQFVPGCGYVLMLPATGAANPRMPKWVRVTSSWTSNEPLDPANSESAKGDVTCVALDLDGTAPASATVIGFENLVRVDQYTVTLD
jgi:hypothetical protein